MPITNYLVTQHNEIKSEIKSEILKIESTLQKRTNQKKHYRNIMDGFNSQNNDDLKKLDELKIQLNKYDTILSQK